MPTFDAGESGLVGTVGLTILDIDGVVYASRATEGITEPVVGSGVYYVADADPALVLTYVWDLGDGGICGSETLHMDSAEVTVDFTPITDILDDIKAKTDTLGGAGSLTWHYTLTQEDDTPISDADVWVTTDEGGHNAVASGRTDEFGVVTFYLDMGSYYVWAQKAGYDFHNPDAVSISSDGETLPEPDISLGEGAISWPYTLLDTEGDPIEAAYIWVTSDVEGHHMLAHGDTNASGVIIFQLDAGTCYIWVQKLGYTFVSPDMEVVS